MICSDCRSTIPNPVRYKAKGAVPYACVWGRNEQHAITMRFVCHHCIADPRYRNVIEDDLLASLAETIGTQVPPGTSQNGSTA
jgi:hypothetical protein